MKRFFLTVLLVLGLGSIAWAAPQQIWVNYGVVTSIPNVDATAFLNEGLISFDTVTVNSNYVYPIGNDQDVNSIPFSTKDTLYYTNATSGTLNGTSAFLFATVTPTTVHSASTFVNHGTINAFDTPAFPDIFSTTTGNTAIPAGSVPVGSHVIIQSTNVINDGTISVGNYGSVQMMASNINLENGVLLAGAVNTGGGFDVDPIDTTGDTEGSLFYNGFNYYVTPASTYDLFWGVTNGGTLHLDQFSPPETTSVNVTSRDGIGVAGLSLPFNFNANFASYVDTYTTDASNTYFNIVFVNTNFIDTDGQLNTNISADVQFGSDFTILLNGGNDLFGEMATVQFAETVPDVITGKTVTNAIYLMDVGAAYTSLVLYSNAASADGYSRPNVFALTTTTPEQWLDGHSSNTVYDPTLIYQANTYLAVNVPYEAAEYGVQIGRDPANVNGAFNFENSFFEIGTNIIFGDGFLDSDILGGNVALPDPTNEPARIDLTGNNVDVAHSRLRAEGIVDINATNIVAGGTTAGSDWGQINSQLGARSGSLVISNFYPTNFQRLRGDIYAWSGNWLNTFTNGATNIYHYHVLVVDQNLGGSFKSAIRNLNLTGTNSINVFDPMYVINQAYFNTTNLTFNADTTFTQNAGSLTMTNMPKLKYFYNNSNADMAVDNILDIGFDVTQIQTPPAGRTYSVFSITNLGIMSATVPLFESMNFENDGVIEANQGSVLIEAANLGLGLTVTNSTNYIVADENVTLSAADMSITNSAIYAGGLDATNLGGLTLESTPTGQITDFVSGDPSTNNVLVNFWQVTDGFSLTTKPATGDLYGTEITTIANGFTSALHTWAGNDLGPTVAGFRDNMVIGHLKLSNRSANGILHFTGAGAQNGMYVDYLELDPNSLSYTNYRQGLVIDPNLTIYFAAANVNPLKLEQVYPNRLVWVQDFAGPNSSVAVLYGNPPTNVCLMNTNVAFSPDISFFPPVPNADNQPYVLNDPNDPTIFTNCPTDMTLLDDLSDGAVQDNFNFASGSGTNVTVIVSTLGQGVVSPHLSTRQITSNRRYSLTATPAKGWIFSGWSANGLARDAATSSRVLNFTIQNNLVLTANFAPTTYTLAQGTYYGLFTNAAPSADNSGWFTFTLGGNGALSGKLLMGPSTYAFSSTLPSSGTVSLVAKHGSTSLNVSLSLNLTDPTGQVTGSVASGAWTSPLLGNVSANWTTKDQSPYIGQYTMVMTNLGTNTTPGGNSYGTLSISKTGVLTIAGQLADGDSFSQSVPVSTNGLWPFYAYAANGKDFLLGWIPFQTSDFGRPTIGETNVYWGKGASAKGDYADGFTNTFGVLGSPYTVPGKNFSGITLIDPVGILSGGNLLETLTNSLAYDGKLTYSSSNLTISINAAKGDFTGKLVNPEGGPAIKLSGAVLQNQEDAFGFFLGTDHETGAVLLKSQ